jgi:hypothetical protein
VTSKITVETAIGSSPKKIFGTNEWPGMDGPCRKSLAALGQYGWLR